MLRLRIFIVRTIAPLLIMWAFFREDGKLLAWAIVELPKLLSEGEGVEDE